MKKISSIFRSGALIFTLCTGLLTGCQSNPSSTSDTPQLQTETSGLSSSNVKLSTNATSVEGQTGLYKLETDVFQGKEYMYLSSFGSNLLLISETNSQTEDFDYDTTPTFIFDVYDPTTDEIVSSLDTKNLDFTCDYYQVLDHQLVLFDYENYGFYFYNEKLSLENTIELDSDDRHVAFALYPSHKDDLYYINDESVAGIYAFEVSKNQYSLTPLESDGYDVSIQDVTDDGKYLLTSGLDSTNLSNQLCLIDPDSMAEITYIGKASYFIGDLVSGNYLYLADVEKNIFQYGSIDGTNKFVLTPPSSNAMIYDDNSIVIQSDPKLSDLEGTFNDPLTYQRYNTSGQCLNAFSFTYDGWITQPAYSDASQCMFFLVSETDKSPYLLIWDLVESSGDGSTLNIYDNFDSAVAEYNSQHANAFENGTDIETDSELFEDAVTAIPDIDSYDWGDLTSANNSATALENTFEIEIFLGPELPEHLAEFDLAQCLDPELAESSLDILEGILSIYPTGFLSQLVYGENQGLRVYLAGTITSDAEGIISEAGGFVTDINNYKVMVLDVNQSYDWSYSVNHEISHMIDKRLELHSTYKTDALYSEDKWNSYNPEDFCYLYSYEGYEDSDLYSQYPEYFMDFYAVTFPTEDRAMLFGAAMLNYLEGSGYEYLFDDPKNIAMQNKFSYYCQCIRDGFDTTDWPEVTPWEQVLVN